jgi:hypothetical protein
MLTKKILEIITIILGVVLILASFYIKSRVEKGTQEISEAQSQVNLGSKLFSLHPITKEVGKGLMESVQNKIDEGTEKSNRYNTIALWFQIGGAFFIVLGAGIIFISKKNN